MRLLSIFLFIGLGGFFLGCQQDTQNRYTSWEVYRGSKEANQYAGLAQINKENVHLLQPAWEFHTGDNGPRTPMECNPIVVGNTMFVTSPKLDLIALHAATGELLWRFFSSDFNEGSGVNRGVTYFDDGADGVIFMPAGPFLFAVNAKNGELVKSFGNEGKIDLREDLGRDPAKLSIALSTPGILYENLLIIGSATGEGYDASPGHVRAYHARTGKLAWIFHTIPQPGEFGYDTWEWLEGENYGGTNNWGGLSLDEEKGWVFVATGSPTYDFYGGNRLGENLFGNCVISLDAKTGERQWHYQAVTHDLWDYDLPCAPTLVTIPIDGKPVKALVQPTKMGELIVLDRYTGKPLLPVEERAVPPSYVPGERAHPTQKFNQGIRLVPQGMDSTYLTDLSEEANAYARSELKKYRNEGMYTPPSIEGTLTMPATRGGSLWGGVSYDPIRNRIYANVNELAMILQLRPVSPVGAEETELSGYRGYMLNCSNCHGADRKGLAEAYPPLLGIADRYSKEEIRRIIRGGKGVMPAFSQFDNAQLDALVSFVIDGQVPTGESVPTEKVDKYVMAGFRLFLDEEGFPASKPPWGTLNAIDLETFSIDWKVPLGDYPSLTARGISGKGTQNFGGCVATAGGLVFVGGSADEMFRAFDADTGEVLWSYKLPAGGYAVPAVYEVDGRQYVVIAAGGANRIGTPSGDSFVAFALP
ncbi:Glucose dehydrogenase, PQQ-dependent [Lunatimonas lonarensis]|uniref:Glucose dehydrogenase, PQQ-dependent n=1 Tax=Lunatimonas lonarensis TaxID=1232681 RepID=R7ZW79_9BACT|nr:PQQ-binding-like beta-propeller repeat protein [Lunatimonas lonarensis]EON78342.1 Glucose dehydrogenase, PQQ-dependent [Lunatimonas lonarensis]